MMEILVSVAEATMGEYVIKPIGRQLSYLICYNRNKKKLKEQLENLKTARRDVHGLVEEARSNAHAILEGVSKWLTAADHVIHDELSNSNPSGFNLVDRYKLGRKTKKRVDDILELIAEGSKFGEVGYRAPLPDTEKTIVPEGYQVLESKISMAKQIMNALAKPEVNKVGVYGMGGVGKTYLLSQVKKLVLEEKLFGRVIEVIVGQSNGVIQIQEQIGDALNIKLPNSKEGRASFIRNNLVKMEGNILIMLDDLWKAYDLIKEIGIPCSDSSKEGCKVLITSRSQDRLTNDMNIIECFQVSYLSKEESWKFFTAIIGDKFDTTDMENVAKKVANECGGLPLALDTIAKALKGKHINYWEDALSRLRNFISMDIEGVSDKVYASLRLSYDHLAGEEIKFLFLLCSVFPDDYEISLNDLLIYAMGLRLLSKVKTWRDAKNRVMKLVHDLKSSSLLLEVNEHFGEKHVKMHDVVRDVAIHIASEEGRMSTMSFGYKLREWEEEYRSGSYRAIFVNCNFFAKLPQKLKFPELELLRLSNRFVECLQIQDAFFEGMEKLKVLDLTGMWFLPGLWTPLKNLRTLCMSKCEFNGIDTISELKNLEILRIFSCIKLDHLPATMSELTQLKVLELVDCYGLVMFPTNIISSMTKLEVLALYDSFNKWGEEVWYRYEGIKNVKLSELNCLPHLSSLRIESSSVKILSEISLETLKNLKEFWISANESDDDIILPVVSCEYATTLILNVESQIGSIDGGLEILLKRCELLDVKDSTNHFTNAIFRPNGNGYPLLKNLRIIDEHGNSDLSYLFGGDFSSLEFLSVKMKRIENIVPRHTTTLPFKKLKKISIESCGQLKSIFSFSVLKRAFRSSRDFCG